jgi:hypothetical protein
MLVLITAMLVLTAITLLINRSAYIVTLRPDPDPNGVNNHFAFDLAGMVAHLLGAWFVVWIFKRAVPA